MTASEPAAPDWEFYRRLKAQGRLNLLLRLSELTAMKLSGIVPGSLPADSNILPFVSRAEHLAWRETWKKGRFVRLSWSAAEREAFLRQDAIFRDEDARWAERHGPTPGGAEVLPSPAEQVPSRRDMSADRGPPL